MRCPLLAALVVGSCVLSRSSVAAQQSTAADTVWRFRAGAGIKRLRECDAAELLVGTKDALVAVDATTGAKLWEQLDLPSLGWGLYMPCGAKTGFSYRPCPGHTTHRSNPGRGEASAPMCHFPINAV